MNLNQVTIFSELPVETVEFFEKLGLGERDDDVEKRQQNWLRKKNLH